MNQALNALIRSLAMIGHDAESLDISKGENDEIIVTLEKFQPAKITVIVSELWRYPGLSCYFVNYSHANGDFSAHVGTPHTEQAIFNIGYCAGLIRLV